MTTTNVPVIRIDEAGVAWIEGTTAKLLEVVLAKLADDLTPEQVQAELPHLSLAQVYAALAYYYAHQAEMDAEIARQREWVKERRDQEQNPLSRADLLQASEPAGTPASQDAERELSEDLEDLRTLLEHGKVEEARGLVQALAQRWPDSERVRHFVRVLAPPVASRQPDLHLRPLERERAWLREHGHLYPGRWLAVLGDRLVTADPDLRVVLSRVRETPGGEHALLHLQPGSAE